MRSDRSSIDQLLMCMTKPQTGDQNGPFSTMKVEPTTLASSDNSLTSYDDNEIMEFGPIKVKPRKKPAPTLATGRRSKYETLTPDEERKREIRRARNRAAAERVRIHRLGIEQQLQEQISALENQQQQLVDHVQQLENEKLQLETRLFTHERMCSSRGYYPPPYQPSTNVFDIPPNFPTNHSEILPESYVDKIFDLDDEILNSILTDPNESNSFENITNVTDENMFDDLLMNV